MDKLSMVKSGENNPRAEREQHLKHVQGHKIKHWNRNNSAADCSIAFKFGTEFHHITGNTLQMFKVKDQRLRSQDQRSRSRRKVMYQQQKRYNTAMDRFSDVKLDMAS